ncbi:MAG: hypothetical protein ABI217_07225 [Chthoniobacterales bacterium]
MIGLAAALAAALVRAILFRFVGAAIPFLTFFPAVILASLWGGTRAGATSSLASLWMVTGFAPMDRFDWFSLLFFANFSRN